MQPLSGRFLALTVVLAFGASAVACSGPIEKNVGAKKPASAEPEGEGDGPGDGEEPVTSEDTDNTLVTTKQGDVRADSVKSGIALFRDVPYAAPPVGSLRWKPPAAPAAWKGEHKGSKFTAGIACRSSYPADLHASVGSEESEDCLYLDVYAPAVKPAAPLPILFFLHGGFGLWGKKGDIDGSELAKVGKMIIVSANYRLGPLGYLAHPALTNEQGSSGNYAHLDQIAALKWVQANIEAFGGDPARVTVSGQSWGGQSSCLLMASPLAKGLFARVFDISGVGCLTASTEDALAAGQTFSTNLGCESAASVPSCLRAAPLEGLRDALPVHLWSSAYRWRATVDGRFLPDKAQSIMRAGKHNHMPLMIGTTSEEASTMTSTIFVPLTHRPEAWTDTDYSNALTQAYGAKAGELLARYPLSDYTATSKVTAATLAMGALLSDDRFVCPARRVARAVASKQAEPVYRYLFDLTGKLRDSLDNGHGTDLGFIFRKAHTPFVSMPDMLTLATHVEDTLTGYISRFVATGDPNGSGALAWNVYDPGSDNAVIIDDPPHAVNGVRTDACDYWDSVTTNP